MKMLNGLDIPKVLGGNNGIVRVVTRGEERTMAICHRRFQLRDLLVLPNLVRPRPMTVSPLTEPALTPGQGNKQVQVM